MVNGESLLLQLNTIQLYTYQYLTYLNEPDKYTVRDLSFHEGSPKFNDVVANISITQEDKDSILAHVNNTDYSHLDLPLNYKQLIEGITPVSKTTRDIRSDFEYAGIKLAKAVQDLVDYFNTTTFDYSTIILTDYIEDLGTGDAVSEASSLTNISNLLHTHGLMSKLEKITRYKSTFSLEFDDYCLAQTLILGHLLSLYSQFKSDSYKPNDLPYIAIRN